MIIDIYTHITPEKYRNALFKRVQQAMGKKMMEGISTLWDLETRFRIMDRYDDYKQVIMVSGIPVESVAKGKDAVELARIANDEAAELIAKYPDRFLAAVALLPLDDTEAALKELDRVVNELKLRGMAIHTPLYFFRDGAVPPAGAKSMDSPELMPVYEKMAEYDLPIWIHPNPLYDMKNPDYTSETEARYFAWQIYGWPYQDTLAQVRLVFSGILEKCPNLKIINHHAGGMVPFFEQRVNVSYDMAEAYWGLDLKQRLPKSPREYLRMFYADTALGGSTPGLMCAYDFYGAEHMVFGTDTPFDKDLGDVAIKATIESVERMNIPDKEKRAIFADNAKKLMLLD